MLKNFYKIIFSLFLILWVSGYVLFIASGITISHVNTSEKTDAIIVLTGGNNRIQTGLKLLHDGVSENLFITGVHPSVTKSDITNMWEEISELPDCCITLGHEATTTRKNSEETDRWLKEHKINNIILVTSNYHMDRALLEFRHKMPNININTYTVIDKTSPLVNFSFWKISFIEYHKFMFRYFVITLSKNFK